MLLDPPSDAVLRRMFERVLQGILSGKLTSAPDGNGLDEQTNAALNALVGDERRRATKILAARTEFARQLDGTHRQEAQADFMSKLLGQ